MTDTATTASPIDDPAATRPARGKGQLVMTLIGWILTILPSGLLLMSAFFKFRPTPEIAKAMADEGWKPETMVRIGIAEVVSTLLLLFPRTAVLGAILTTGYLGGAIATHVHSNTDFSIPAAMGVIIWIALVFREPRLRPLAPWRTPTK